MILGPVSYTHLDVYKRQVESKLVCMLAKVRNHVGQSGRNQCEIYELLKLIASNYFGLFLKQFNFLDVCTKRHVLGIFCLRIREERKSVARDKDLQADVGWIFVDYVR